MTRRLPKKLYGIAASGLVSLLFSLTAYAQTISYVRGELSYPVYVEQVHPEQIEVTSFQLAEEFDIEYVLETDPASYSEGEAVPMTVRFIAKEGKDFTDIKKASIKISDTEPESFELTEGNTVLTAHFTFPAMSVQLKEPENLYFESYGIVGWDPVKNADFYEIEIERMDEYGQRCYRDTLTAKSNRASVRDYIFSAPGDYLYSVRACSDRYFRDDSDKASLPLSMSVMVTEDDIGLSGNIIDNDGRVYLDGEYAKNRELKIRGSYYYFGPDSTWITGWRKEKDDWFYYDPETHKRVDGPQTIGKDEYYFDEEDGSMQTGFKVVDGKEKFYAGNGKATTGWVAYEGNIYYILKSGERNTAQLQDSAHRNYIFDENGILIQ